jgi:UDP-N-acetylmuramoyl-tripeptide--D-alanyl-D-alanine ligase
MQLTLADLHELLGGKLRMGSMPPCDGDTTLVGPVVVDSREVESDEVFWGLVGSRFNGAHFAEEAFVRGASGVVVSGRRVEPWAGRWALEVDDSQKSMWQLATWNRNHCDTPIVAVSGSVGKSITLQMIDTVLGYRLSGPRVPRNCSNKISVPLALLGMQKWHRYGVVEIAASRPGEVAHLARVARPQIGVITNLSSACPIGFASAEAHAAAHAELLSELPRGCTAVLNADDPAVRRLAGQWAGRIVWIGRGTDCDICATDVVSADGHLQFRVGQQKFDIGVWGRHHLTAALAAIAVGRSFGLDFHEIATALSGFRSMALRCDVSQTTGVQLIDDTYDSDPISMRAALELLREIETHGRRVVVAGDYRELAGSAEAWHERLGQEIVCRAGADMLIACGRHAARVVASAVRAGMPAEDAIACNRVEDAVERLSKSVRPGDAVLLKGARAMRMERIVEALKSRLTTTAAPLRIAA